MIGRLRVTYIWPSRSCHSRLRWQPWCRARPSVLYGLPAFAQSAFEREAKDRAEIEKLMCQYARTLDTENADAYVRKRPAMYHTSMSPYLDNGE